MENKTVFYYHRGLPVKDYTVVWHNNFQGICIPDKVAEIIAEGLTHKTLKSNFEYIVSHDVENNQNILEWKEKGE